MWILVLITLIGIHLIPFVPTGLDHYSLQGAWVQSCIAIMFSCLFFYKQNNIIVKDIGLGLLNMYLALHVALICYMFQVHGRFDTKHFFAYFNFLCLIIFYQIIMKTLSGSQVEKILVFMKYSVLGVLFLCVLQSCGVSQFFQLLYENNKSLNNMVTGTIANGSHLSGFLAMTSPLFMYKPKREDYLALLLMFFVLFFTGTTAGDPSISGFIILTILICYMFLPRWKPILIIVLFGIIAIAYSCYFFPEQVKSFIRFTGRIHLWSTYWPICKKYFVTGIGPGGLMAIWQQSNIYARHLHQEYYQILLETGIVGFILTMNWIFNFLKSKVETDLDKILKACVIGFLLSCFFNYPAHLWLPATWAMFFYAAFRLNENERLTYV